MYPTSTPDRSATFAELRKRNITTVTVHFSGGNDEGSADEITATLADGSELSLNDAASVYRDRSAGHFVYDPSAPNNRRPATSEEIAESDLTEALEAPIYEVYSGFAGDFYVNGTVTWDVAAGKVTMQRSERVEAYEDSELDL